jgi:predicted ATP-dependent protease
MVGRPGTGKSMLANMFKEVLEQSLGDYLRPQEAIIAYPGKDKNHVRIAYEDPEKIEHLLDMLMKGIDSARDSVDEFSLADQIQSSRKAKQGLLVAAVIGMAAGIFYPAAFVIAGLTGMGAIFMYMQENNHKAQEKIQRESNSDRRNAVKHLDDMVPDLLYDPRKDQDLMARISEPDARNMKGGFRHDPYQSGNLETPCHKRAYLGAHAKSPIIYIDELKTLIKVGYMAELLETAATMIRCSIFRKKARAHFSAASKIRAKSFKWKVPYPKQLKISGKWPNMLNRKLSTLAKSLRIAGEKLSPRKAMRVSNSAANIYSVNRFPLILSCRNVKFAEALFLKLSKNSDAVLRMEN